MVTKTKRGAALPRARKVEPPIASPASADTAKPGPLRAGLKALGKVRDDVVQHQSRVFEALLGIEPGAGWSGLVKRDTAAGRLAQDALGLRKFEAVFDQRVASALERLGMPNLEALQALGDEVAALKAEVAALKAASAAPTPAPPPARRRASAKAPAPR